MDGCPPTLDCHFYERWNSASTGEQDQNESSHELNGRQRRPYLWNHRIDFSDRSQSAWKSRVRQWYCQKRTVFTLSDGKDANSKLGQSFLPDRLSPLDRRATAVGKAGPNRPKNRHLATRRRDTVKYLIHRGDRTPHEKPMNDRRHKQRFKHYVRERSRPKSGECHGKTLSCTTGTPRILLNPPFSSYVSSCAGTDQTQIPAFSKCRLGALPLHLQSTGGSPSVLAHRQRSAPNV